ncbi:hypothetical protein D3C73_1215410 [compost metagenome]
MLYGLGRVHQQHPVQPRVGLAAAHFGQQRDRRQRIGAGGLLALLLHQTADGRVGDRFQRRPLGRVCKDVGAQTRPVQAAVGQQHVRAEAFGNQGQGRAADCHHRACGKIGVGHDNPQRLEAPGHLTLARGDAAGQANHILAHGDFPQRSPLITRYWFNRGSPHMKNSQPASAR